MTDPRDERPNETIDVECRGRRFRIGRFCPHAGVDLARFGRVDETDGSIVCTAHHFRFDLTTGRCGLNPAFALETRPLDDV